MKNKLNAYQQIINQANQENLSYKLFDSIKKYIEDGINKDYKNQVRLKMLANGSLLCSLTLEHISCSLPLNYIDSVVKIIYKIGEKIREEMNKEFSQDFSDAIIALEELKKITK